MHMCACMHTNAEACYEVLALIVSQKCRPLNVIRMVVCSIPAVVDITIVRPDLKYQLGFSVHEGMVSVYMCVYVQNYCCLWNL